MRKKIVVLGGGFAGLQLSEGLIGSEYDVILIDASETPIERPKKNKKLTIQGKRKNTP